MPPLSPFISCKGALLYSRTCTKYLRRNCTYESISMYAQSLLCAATIPASLLGLRAILETIAVCRAIIISLTRDFLGEHQVEKGP
jgi:hypothetical protein